MGESSGQPLPLSKAPKGEGMTTPEHGVENGIIPVTVWYDYI